MEIHEAGEMYLETILVLSQTLDKVRMIDISRKMGYSKPTVSVVLKKFREAEYIYTDDTGHITLSSKGKEIAEKIYRRHNYIAKFLMAIGVDEPTALADACKMEHDISDLTFECMKKHLKSIV